MVAPSYYFKRKIPHPCKKTASQMKDELIEAFFAVGGKNRLIRECKENSEKFWELVKVVSRFVPKEIDLKQDTTINLVMSLPRPDGEQLAIEKQETVELIDATINGEAMKSAISEDESEHIEECEGEDEL